MPVWGCRCTHSCLYSLSPSPHPTSHVYTISDPQSIPSLSALTTPSLSPSPFLLTPASSLSR